MQHPLRHPPTGEPATITARHMAEAVTFLMRVAAEAGLSGVALDLRNLRARLIRLAVTRADKNGRRTQKTTPHRHGGHAGRDSDGRGVRKQGDNSLRRTKNGRGGVRPAPGQSS